MSADASPVTTNIDYQKDGKQVGYLRVPHSHNTSAWGSILIPITVIKSGQGPTVLFTGGVHGDEYEGPVALIKLARRLSVSEINGRLIILPGLNFPALQAGKRLSPIDNKDMNRVFPGDPKGTISQVIAHYIREAVLPLCDDVIDLLSGGYSLYFVPYISMQYLEYERQRAATLAAMQAFQAPVSMVIKEIGGEGLMDYEVENMGKIFLCAEMAGAGMFSPSALKIAETGIRNLLVHFGMQPGEIQTRESQGQPPPVEMEIPSMDYYSLAPSSGIFEPFFELGDWINSSEQLGQIHSLEHVFGKPSLITAQRSGRII
ncbi:MAG: succinylglutamate desuccinylase/aspartoacylase family protein, partial [Anaerolineales bacterium]